MNTTLSLEFITPLFSKGFYDDLPEVRSPSIRGQLHWWFRATGGRYEDEKAIFGGVHGSAVASKVVVRVIDVQGRKDQRATLPHKQGGQASAKTCYLPGTRFQLHLLSRLGGLASGLQSQFDRALEAWLLLGTLGLRGTRAAGSFHCLSATGSGMMLPDTFASYEKRCQELLQGKALRFALLSQTYSQAEVARRDVSDTLGGREDRAGQMDLERLNDPLGRIHGGRKTSPLRFRIVRMGNEFRIAALWDAREMVTGNIAADLQGIISLLAQKKPALGKQLQNSALAAS